MEIEFYQHLALGCGSNLHITMVENFLLVKANFNCNCYQKFWPTDFPKGFSKVENLGVVWSLMWSFAGAVISAHYFSKPGPKYSSGNSKSVTNSGPGRQAGAFQGTKGSEDSFMLTSSWKSPQLPLFPHNGWHRNQSISAADQPVRPSQSLQYSLLTTAGNTAGYEVMLFNNQRQVIKLAIL